MSNSKIRGALGQLDPRPRNRLNSRLLRAAKWAPVAALLAAGGVFAYRYATANSHFATRDDD